MTRINSALASTLVSDYVKSALSRDYTKIFVTKDNHDSWYALIDEQTGDALVPCTTCIRIYRKREYHL